LIIRVIKDSNVIAELNGQKAVAEYLGVSVGKVAYMLRYDRNHNGLSLQAEKKERRSGNSVMAITERDVFLFPSLSDCAAAYGLSKRQLYKLIETGGTADDGFTTFDIPIK